MIGSKISIEFKFLRMLDGFCQYDIYCCFTEPTKLFGVEVSNKSGLKSGE